MVLYALLDRRLSDHAQPDQLPARLRGAARGHPLGRVRAGRAAADGGARAALRHVAHAGPRGAPAARGAKGSSTSSRDRGAVVRSFDGDDLHRPLRGARAARAGRGRPRRPRSTRTSSTACAHSSRSRMLAAARRATPRRPDRLPTRSSTRSSSRRPAARACSAAMRAAAGIPRSVPHLVLARRGASARVADLPPRARLGARRRFAPSAPRRSMRMHILERGRLPGGRHDADDHSRGPLTGLRAIEFGQLLAGPFVGTLLGDFGADVIKVEAPRERRRDARLGPPAPQRPLAVVVDPGAQQALASRSTCASREGQRIAAELCADGRHRARELPARHDGEVGPRPRAGARASTRAASTPASPATARPAATATAPGFASGGEAIAGLRYINGYPDQAPPRCGHLARRHARRAVRVPGHPARALRPRRARRRRARSSTRAIVDACFAMTRVARCSSTRRCGFVREPTGPRAAARSRPSQRLPLQGRQVGRDRGQPRHAVAAPGDAHGPAGAGGGRALRHPPRARRARGPARRDHRRVGRPSTPRTSSTRSSTTAASCARPSTRPQTSTRTRTSASASCSWSTEDEVHGHDDRARGRAEADAGTPGVDPPGRPLDGGRRHDDVLGRSSASRPRSIAAPRRGRRP